MKQGQTEQLVTETSGVETEVEGVVKEEIHKPDQPEVSEEIPANITAILEKAFLESISDGKFTELEKWVSGATNDVRLASIENSVARQIGESHVINPPIIEFLGRLEQKRTLIFITKELAVSLELYAGTLSKELQEYLHSLIESDDQSRNLIFHKILDFVHQYTVTVQDPPLSLELDERNEYRYGSLREICLFLAREIENSRNYLIKTHIRDILETHREIDTKKEGALHGVAGGSSDETIYAFSHVAESYKNHLKLDLYKGYPIANPLLPISPGFLGLYENGILKEIYEDNHLTQEQINKKENAFIANNNPADEYIYDRLNEPILLSGSHSHPSNKLRKLQDVWDFEKHLRSSGNTFYYDMTRIDVNELHPMVVGDLYTNNQEYIHALGKTENEIRPIDRSEWLRLLYPVQNQSDDGVYGYLNLTKLHMRKKIERDFGVDIASLDFATQRNFLEFLESRDIDTVSSLQSFAHKYGQDGLKTFLSLEYDRSLGEKIVKFGTGMSPEYANGIFEKYGAIIGASQEVEKFVHENYGREVDADTVETIRRRLTKKAAEILSSFIDEAGKGPDDDSRSMLVARLDAIQSDILVLANSFRAMHRHENLQLGDIREAALETYVPGEKISDKTKDQMVDIFTGNRAHGEYPERLAEASKKEFMGALESQTGEFHVLTFHDKVLAFVRFEPRGESRLYVGSLNVRPEIKGTDLGTEFISRLIEAKSSGHSLEAAVWENNRNLPFFIKALGFNRAGELPDHLGSGERFIRLERVQGK